MRRKFQIAIIIWLLLVLSIWLASVSPKLAAIADLVVLVLLVLALDVGGSIYKLRLWFRYRRDIAKRESLSSSTQVYPEKLRRFLMDEADEEKKQ